jgi:hypothetical protein
MTEQIRVHRLRKEAVVAIVYIAVGTTGFLHFVHRLLFLTEHNVSKTICFRHS